MQNSGSPFSHTPVMLAECVEGLNIRPDGHYLDGTAGGAGHAAAIAEILTVSGRLYCTDRDPEAVAVASDRLSKWRNAVVKEGDYKDAGRIFGLCENSLDGALLDLGVSSFQLDSADRGFSYLKEGALDMRMGREGETAADLVNTLSWQQLADLLRAYGEEPNAGLIARKIESERQKTPIDTTTRLSEIVNAALPAAVRRKDKNPARRTFQALRIAVNGELDSLQQGLEMIFTLLKPQGRFCILTFHSLEDRMVKRYFASLFQGCTCPPDFPVCVCGNKPKAKAVTKKPRIASEQEMQLNRRARSAKLRILEKLAT